MNDEGECRCVLHLRLSDFANFQNMQKCRLSCKLRSNLKLPCRLKIQSSTPQFKLGSTRTRTRDPKNEPNGSNPNISPRVSIAVYCPLPTPRGTPNSGPVPTETKGCDQRYKPWTRGSGSVHRLRPKDSAMPILSRFNRR